MAQQTPSKYVEVIYIHGQQRCATCKTVEKHTKELVYADFANQMKNGSVRFKEVDIATPEGEKLTDKYRVSWSALYANGWKSEKESRNDLTRRHSSMHAAKQKINGT